MKIGIIGSRDWLDVGKIRDYLESLSGSVEVVSGGAKGADSICRELCKELGIRFREIVPDLVGCRHRGDFSERYYERNSRIVSYVDRVVAFVTKDSGGSWDVIKKAYLSNKGVEIVKSDNFRGIFNESGAKKSNCKAFQLKNVSLGSYVLKLKRYFSIEDWGMLISGKDGMDRGVIDMVTGDFVKFFLENDGFGHIDFLTVPCRSVRNLGKVHFMEEVLSGIGKELRIEVFNIFSPYDKIGRGRFSLPEEGDISYSCDIGCFKGKSCFVLDDIVTTGRTLGSCVRKLMRDGVHAHGLGYALAT